MFTNDQAADKLESIINGMFTDLKSFSPNASEYGMFYDPAKHAAWLMIIYFEDSNTLNAAIKNGTCYKMHSYISDRIKTDPATSGIQSIIFFEYGKRPCTENEVSESFSKFVSKILTLENANDGSGKQICNNCGHDFDQHEMLCNLAEGETPTHGWISCPEKDCNCFLTWGANYDTSAKE